MRNCGVVAVAAITKRPIAEIEARIRADRERRGNGRRGLKNIRTTYMDELMRVVQRYGFALSSEWPRRYGMLHTWHRGHRHGTWLIRVGGHMMAKRGRYWWNVLPGQKRVTHAVRCRKIKGGGR